MLLAGQGRHMVVYAWSSTTHSFIQVSNDNARNKDSMINSLGFENSFAHLELVSY